MQTSILAFKRQGSSFTASALVVLLFSVAGVARGQMAGILTGPPQLTLMISGTTISVDGATPNGSVLFFAIQEFTVRHGTAFRRIERITETAQNGHAELTNIPAVRVAVWCAVDLTTGRYTTGTPEAVVPRAIPANIRSLKSTTSEDLNRYSIARPSVEGVLVRPGGRAWAFTVGDGTASDADGEVNGRVECRIDQMRPLGTSGSPPKTFLPSDTLFVIDPSRLALDVVEVRR